jgi:hypothetical protein
MRIEKIGFARYRIGSVDFSLTADGFVSASSDWPCLLRYARRDAYGFSFPDTRSTNVKFNLLSFESLESEYRRVRDAEIARVEANRMIAAVRREIAVQ